MLCVHFSKPHVVELSDRRGRVVGLVVRHPGREDWFLTRLSAGHQMRPMPANLPDLRSALEVWPIEEVVGV